ncbi:hypothetical protein [Actinoplanes sp. NPDC051859]|uniref:hypothetical protein n=1 Tax=Actinoplanes sp. NPDC051859 TaxID=3363909 RepID=UPI0037A72507
MVIATVFLSIIGMSAGFALGTRHESSPPAPPVNLPTPSVGVTEGTVCPAEMLTTARRAGLSTALTEVLQVRTTDTGMVVWICQDPSGALYYQANDGGEAATWIEGQTALFLAKVTLENGTYVATASDGNTFHVNKRQLRIRTKNGEQTHPVVPQ